MSLPSLFAILLLCMASSASAQSRMARCVDYYKAGKTGDKLYQLEVSPRVLVSVYCKDMKTGKPMEYLPLTKGAATNYARYYRSTGLESSCGAIVPRQDWKQWGSTQFRRIRFDFDGWIVKTDDYAFATSVNGGADIPYGQAGDMYYDLRQAPCRQGTFCVDLTGTPYEVSPNVIWSWQGQMEDNLPNTNDVTDSSSPRQKVCGKCGGFPGTCFPALSSAKTVPKLKLQLVSSHPCVDSKVENPCQNLGKCLVTGANTYTCQCLPGWSGSKCEEPQPDSVVTGPKSRKADDAKSRARCPAGYTLTNCKCSLSACDGVFMPANGDYCDAVNANNRNQVQAIANCTKYNTSLITTTVTRVPASGWNGGRNPTYTCPKGATLVACTWRSPWYRSGRPVKWGLGTVTGNKCTADCGTSTTKSCAIFAKCLRVTCPCQNGGTCSGFSSHCYCPEGYVGELCETFDYCAWQVQNKGSPSCLNGGTCRSKPATAVSTFGGDGTGDCQFPTWWQGKQFSRCISNCSVGPPFACAVQTDGSRGWVDLGWWSPGIVYTLEAWVRPSAHVAGRKTIMGTMDSCSDYGVSLNNGKFSLVYTPVSGCSATATTTKTAYINQWHHVAMTADGTYATLYVNGTQIKQVQTRSNFQPSARGFRLGGEICCANNDFAGYIKNFRVWKRSIGAPELLSFYTKPQDPFNTTDYVLRKHLIAHYEFCDNPPQNCHGKDWGYQDWYPANGDTVDGVHCNVRTFYIKRGVTVKVSPWVRDAQGNSGTKGTFEVYAQDIVIEGTLTAQGAGYKGGDRPTKVRQSGIRGESFSSSGSTGTGQYQGGGGGGLGDTNSRAYGKPGGGGGYGSAGKNGFDKKNNQAGVGKGGGTYGAGNMRVLHLGGGGGSGGNDNSISSNPIGGKGGNGGGGIHLDARNTLHVTGRVSANGDPGQGDSASGCSTATCQTSSSSTCFDFSGPGGGGAGGSVYLRALVVDVGTNKVTASGGRGGYGTSGCGGSGGNGRIRIDFGTDKMIGSTAPNPVKYQFNDTFNDLATLPRQSLPLSQITSATDPSVYLGCYQDTVGNRHLKFQTATSQADKDKMTPDYCRQQCYKKGYKYYGVEYAFECFCDNDYGKQGLKSNRDCNSPCLGDKSLKCGGGNRISIYGPIPKRPAQAMATAVQTCQPWCRVGYSQKTKQRLYGYCTGAGKVTSWDIQCLCPAGYRGSRCENTCPKNKYGLNCKNTCKCKNNGVCNPVSGSCDCPAGWTGATCTTQCPQGKFGPNCDADCKCVTYCTPDSCPGDKLKYLFEAESGQLGARKSGYYFANSSASNGTVIKAIGSSRFSPSTSSSGSTSWLAMYYIDVAIAGSYSVWINVYAPHGRADSLYVRFGNGPSYTFHIPNSESFQWRKFGRTYNFANPGRKQLQFFIREADLQIDQVFLGTNKAVSTCNRFKGTCTCAAGYTGQYCDQPCPDRKYGVGCKKTCTCKSGTCDPKSGECHCFPGYEGADCDKKCAANKYGTNCNSKCQCKRGTCDHVSGACACPVGYYGNYCGTVCPQGRWGQNCSSVCACRHSAPCDAKSGKCQCPPGYTGNDCGTACPVGFFGQGCTKKCTCLSQYSTCDHVSGKCVCYAGYRGAKCDLLCQGGKCGLGCTTNCGCNSGTCDKFTCKCNCWSGWTGNKCAVRCPQGTYGSNCANKCPCVRGTCNRNTGQCYCPPGWKGSSCNAPCASNTFGKNCATQCKCDSVGSSKCDPVTGACTCKPGFAGLFCETACPSGKFGADCLGNCNCKNNGTCHSIHGSCDCPRGYTGQTCEKTCSANTFGYLCAHNCQCQNGATCDFVDGSCTCAAGYSGDVCDSPCPAGTYGLDCQSSCLSCVQGQCDSVTGKCTCSPGWMGVACDQPCPKGMYGDQCKLKCSCVNGDCDNVNGTCTCDDGYYGVDCALACAVGTYGVGCSLACSRVCNNSLPGCDPTDGHCICQPGWTGPWCNVTCPNGYYGQDCTTPCKKCSHPLKNLVCSPFDGSCVCDFGYIGELCDEACDDGWYGLNCTQQCACPIGRSTCDVSDGSCVCNPGYKGDDCLTTCLQGFYGAGCLQSCNCDTRYGFCNPQDGKCQCYPGFYGDDCRTPCSKDKWGADCAEDCLCLFGECDHATGGCTCYSGYTGENCDQPCGNNTFGPGCSTPCGCQNGADCDLHTGLCYCTPGFIGRYCDSECDENFFGHLCTRQCDCLNEATCNKTTGECHCTSGYRGDQCELLCPDGLWGPHCRYPCGVCGNGRCDPMTGGCLCDNGYEGNNCTQVCSGSSWGNNCKNPCPDCYNNYGCDAFSGHCLCGGKPNFCGERGVCSTAGQCQCDPGFIGEDCNRTCSANSYGEGCQSECLCSESSTCNAVDGTCTCAAGTYGTRCTLICDCGGVCDQETGECIGEAEQTGGASKSTVIIVVAVCCVVGGILIAIAVFAYLRYKAKKDETGMSFSSNVGGEAKSGMTMSGAVQFERDSETVGFGNPIYDSPEELIDSRKSNPIYHSQDDNLDGDD